MLDIFKRKDKKDNTIVNNESFEKLSDAIDTESIDSIYPFSWLEKKGHIETGENYLKTLVIVDYPQSVKGAYLSNLLRKNGNVEITQFIRPANIETMINHLNNSIKNRRAELIRVTDPKRKATLEREIKSSEQQLDKFLDEKTGFMYLYMYITLKADSLEKIDALESDLKRILTRLRLKAHTPTNAMREAFHTTLPLNQNYLGNFTQQNMDTKTAGHFYMFDDSEIIDLSENTTLFGVNKNTDSLVSIDFTNRNKTLNKNMTIIGTSGVGKSTLNMRLVLDYIKKGTKIFIIDPEDEFTNITEYYGGTVINVSTSSDIRINPFEIFSEELFENEDEDNVHEVQQEDVSIETLVRSKIGKLKTFFRVLKDEITQSEISVLSSTLRKIYEEKGFTGNAKLEDFNTEDYPTLTDLYNKIKDYRTDDQEKYNVLKDLFLIIEDYTVEHGTTTIFDGYTNVKLDNQIVTFNLKALQTERDVQSASYLNIFSFLWDEITKDRTTEVALMTDELHFLATNEYSLDFYYQAYKRIRKYNGYAIASTQQIKDILRTSRDIGSAIIENSHTKFFFGMDNVGVDDVINNVGLNFSEQEISHLTKKKRGEALVIYGTQRAFIKIDLDQEEIRLWDKKLYEKLFNLPAEEEVNYVEKLGLDDLDVAELEEKIRQYDLMYKKEEV